MFLVLFWPCLVLLHGLEAPRGPTEETFSLFSPPTGHEVLSQSTLLLPHLQVQLLAPLHLVARPVELLLDRQTRVIVALKEVLEVEDEVDDGAGPCLENLYFPIVEGLSANLLMALMTSYLPWREDRRGT